MKSNYIQCDDIEPDEIVIYDEAYRKTDEEPICVRVITIGHITALVENVKGNRWTLCRNRLTKIKGETICQEHLNNLK